MKRIITLFLVVWCLGLTALAQESKLVGTWKRHVDEVNRQGANTDKYIKIYFDEGQFFVSVKYEGINPDGNPYKAYYEGENVVFNDNGSLSFDTYFCKNEYDEDDKLYWTGWYYYVVYVKGGRLYESVGDKAFGANKNGQRIRNQANSPENHVYYNLNDNW